MKFKNVVMFNDKTYLSIDMNDLYRINGCDMINISDDIDSPKLVCDAKIAECNYQNVNVWCPYNIKMKDILK